jgi:tRNA pseudouridine55 synthase
LISSSGGTSRQAIDGVLLVDKPHGITSQAAVTRAKRLIGAAKAGHTGTLDPMATGLLPIAFGEATKFSHALLEADKSYTATVRLGVTTTTGDLEGEVVNRASVAVRREEIDAALAQFRGEIQQTPPMYSALKHAGKPLYAYARAGTEVPRVPRRIRIVSLELEHYAADELRIRVTCSKGTYIRVLAEDIGAALGCGACLAALTRTEVGRFGLDAAIGLDALGQLSAPERLAHLLPIDALVAELPRLEIDREHATRLLRGQPVAQPHGTTPGLVRIYGPDAAFLGLAEAAQPDRLVARRLVAVKPANA